MSKMRLAKCLWFSSPLDFQHVATFTAWTVTHVCCASHNNQHAALKWQPLIPSLLQNNLQTERHLQTRCKWQSTMGFPRAGRTERLLSLLLFGVFWKQVPSGMNSQPRMGSVVTPHWLSMEKWIRWHVNQMKQWLKMHVDLASWERRRVAIREVVLSRNVWKLQDWLTIVSGSNAFSHTMMTWEIVSFVKGMRLNCRTQRNRFVVFRHACGTVNGDSKSMQFATFC